MMLDEPYRFSEAVSNRRDYVEDQLRDGSPVIGLTYGDGILLLTMGRGQKKLYEIYDRIAMGSMGHPTDIEKLRQAAVDLASVVGFNYSDADVTLQQIVHFGLGPAVKGMFDDFIRTPYIARILLAELDDDQQGSVFYTVDYDGSFATHEGYAAVGGSTEADRAMKQRLDADHQPDASLQVALEVGLKAWSAGRSLGLQDEAAEEEETTVQDDEIQRVLGEAVAEMTAEALVLNRSRSGKSKVQLLTSEEVKSAIDAVVA